MRFSPIAPFRFLLLLAVLTDASPAASSSPPWSTGDRGNSGDAIVVQRAVFDFQAGPMGALVVPTHADAGVEFAGASIDEGDVLVLLEGNPGAPYLLLVRPESLSDGLPITGMLSLLGDGVIAVPIPANLADVVGRLDLTLLSSPGIPLVSRISAEPEETKAASGSGTSVSPGGLTAQQLDAFERSAKQVAGGCPVTGFGQGSGCTYSVSVSKYQKKKVCIVFVKFCVSCRGCPKSGCAFVAVGCSSTAPVSSPVICGKQIKAELTDPDGDEGPKAKPSSCGAVQPWNSSDPAADPCAQIKATKGP